MKRIRHLLVFHFSTYLLLIHSGCYGHLEPSGIFGTVFWGVVAGVISPPIVATILLVLGKIFLPWYQSKVYQGVDLSGTWVFRQSLGGIQYDYRMVLTQKVHKLDGTKTLTKSGASAGPRGDYSQGFKVSGSTWEGFVILNMKSDDRRSLAFATSMLQIRDRGNSLVGQLVYRSSQVDEVGSEAVHWTRA
jgi:hypothetical protein